MSGKVTHLGNSSGIPPGCSRAMLRKGPGDLKNSPGDVEAMCIKKKMTTHRRIPYIALLTALYPEIMHTYVGSPGPHEIGDGNICRAAGSWKPGWLVELGGG